MGEKKDEMGRNQRGTKREYEQTVSAPSDTAARSDNDFDRFEEEVKRLGYSYVGSGHEHGQVHKKQKFEHRSYLPASPSLEMVSSSSLPSLSTPIKEAQDTSGTPGSKTPTSVSSAPLASSKSSDLFPQNSLVTTAFEPLALVPSSANRDSVRNLREDVSHEDQLDLFMGPRFFERSTTKDIFHNLKINLGPALLKRLKELSDENPTLDVGLEMADSAYLLKLLDSSSPKLETAGRKAGEGAMLLQEGMKLIAECQKVLLSAIPELPSVD